MHSLPAPASPVNPAPPVESAAAELAAVYAELERHHGAPIVEILDDDEAGVLPLPPPPAAA